MKTLDITPYGIPAPPLQFDGQPPPPAIYPVKDSLVNLLFAQQGLKARDLLRRDDVGRKIINCDSNELVLEDAEFDLLKQAVEAFEGYGRNEAELVRRVLAVE